MADHREFREELLFLYNMDKSLHLSCGTMLSDYLCRLFSQHKWHCCHEDHLTLHISITNCDPRKFLFKWNSVISIPVMVLLPMFAHAMTAQLQCHVLTLVVTSWWWNAAVHSAVKQTRWHHQMETFSALLALCAGNSLVTGKFPTQRPVTQSFDVFFDLCLNRRLSKQS